VEAEPGKTRASPDPVGEHDAVSRSRLPARIVGSMRVDLSPLRSYRQYRLLFIGQGVSFAGSMVTYVALPYQAYELSHSSLVVGLISLCELVPILIMAFVGGALADSVDRRLMVRLTETAMCLVVGSLVLNASLAHPQLWVLFVTAAIAAGVDALQRPSLEALIPRLVPPEHLPAAVSLDTLRGTVGQVVGPPVAGVLIAAVGLRGAYGIDVLSFGASLAALSLMRAVPPPAGAERISIRTVVAGVRYAWARKDLLGTYAVDINAMFFGMPMALFPQIAVRYGGAGVLGLLYAAPSAGAFLASVTSGWIGRVVRQGKAIALAAGVWGLAIVGFGLASRLWLALLALAVAGAADAVSGLFRGLIWRQTIPDELRGRLAGIEMISYTSGPALGNLEAGVLESLAGLRTSIVSGGILCVVGTVALAASLPPFWRFRAQGPDGGLTTRR
jgi:MFS family permease